LLNIIIYTVSQNKTLYSCW